MKTRVARSGWASSSRSPSAATQVASIFSVSHAMASSSKRRPPLLQPHVEMCASQGPHRPSLLKYLAGMEAAASQAGVKLCAVPGARLDQQDAVIGIDLQYDFLPGGAFGVPEGDDTLKPFANLLSAGAAAGATVIVSRDYHPHDHASFNTQGGPFPPHCLQGSRGSRLAATVAKAMTAAKKAHPNTVDVVFKGWHRHVDSFGAFPYPEEMAQGRLVHRQPQPHCSYLSWTGAATLLLSPRRDINAPPDVLAAEERTPSPSGSALGETSTSAGWRSTFAWSTRPSPPRPPASPTSGSFSTSRAPLTSSPSAFWLPADLFAKISAAGVKLCMLKDMYPAEHVGEMK